MRAIVLVLGMLVAGACGQGAEAVAAEQQLKNDVESLQDVMATDPALGPLEEVEAEVDNERPIHASEMLRSGAIPAARRQMDRVEALVPVTDRGRTLQTRLGEAYRKRLEALEAYRVALAR